MKNIVLLCAQGMSTSLLVSKMKAAAKEIGYECNINAYSLAQGEEKGKGADIVLLGPQVRHNLAAMEKALAPVLVEAIDMRAYGTMNGKKIIDDIKRKLG